MKNRFLNALLSDLTENDKWDCSCASDRSELISTANDISGALVQISIGVCFLSGEGLCRFHAARTAAQVSGAVVSLPVRGLRLNWCFLIFCANSMPRMVTAAVSNRLNPSIGRIRFLIRRWSRSIRLFKYLLDRTHTRCDSVPTSFQFGHRLVRGGVAVQGDHPWSAGLPGCPDKEPFCGCNIAAFTQTENPPCDPGDLHRAVQVDPLATDLEIRFVHAPGIAHRQGVTAS